MAESERTSSEVALELNDIKMTSYQSGLARPSLANFDFHNNSNILRPNEESPHDLQIETTMMHRRDDSLSSRLKNILYAN